MSDKDGASVGVLVMAHGTPESLDDLPAFYTEIRRGQPPTHEQLRDLERRYVAIGGTSPLNAITAAQADGIAAALGRHLGTFTVRWGTRFCRPRMEEALTQLAVAGASHIVALVLTPHSSRVSVAEYERRARAAAGDLPLHMVDHWYDEPGFDEMVARRIGDALASLPEGRRHDTPVLFTAHSVPMSVLRQGDTYAEQVETSAGAAAKAAGVERYVVAWQSAGRTDDEWLGPDVRDVIGAEARRGSRAVVVCPIGFVADHLEVLYDVDVEARAVADAAGLAFARTASFNADGDFCALLASVVARAAESADR